MVRSPLARRIPTDDALNTVACFLPRFERGALTKITEELTEPGEPGSAADVVVNARLFDRNADIDVTVFDLLEPLPSLPPPDALASPLRRAKALAKLLTDDSAPGGALMPHAGEQLTQALNAKLDGLAAEHAADVAVGVKDIESANIHRTTITSIGETVTTGVRTTATALKDIDRDTRKIVNSVKEGVGLTYFRHRVNKAGEDSEAISIRIEVAALLRLEWVATDVEATATKWVQDRFAGLAVEIKNTTGATRDAYQKVKEQASEPEVVGLELKTALNAPTKKSNAEDAGDLRTYRGHVYSGADGRFPRPPLHLRPTVVADGVEPAVEHGKTSSAPSGTPSRRGEPRWLNDDARPE